jgi:branched-subunit amino acid ABC-type transport system permease component
VGKHITDGAFILGLLEAVIGWKLGLLWVLPFWFIVLLIILLIRPHGLFGKETA